MSSRPSFKHFQNLCMATYWITDDLLFNSLQGQGIFIVAKMSTPALGSTQGPIIMGIGGEAVRV